MFFLALIITILRPIVVVIIVVVAVALGSLILIIISFALIIFILREVGAVGCHINSDRSGFFSFKKGFVFDNFSWSSLKEIMVS